MLRRGDLPAPPFQAQNLRRSEGCAVRHNRPGDPMLDGSRLKQGNEIVTIRFPLGTTSNSSGTPPDTPRATPPGTPPDTPRPTPRATQRRVPLVKQGGKARLSLPVDLKKQGR